MTKIEIMKRLEQLPSEIKAADENRDGDRAADLTIEQGELEAALAAIEIEEEGDWDHQSDEFDREEDC